MKELEAIIEKWRKLAEFCDGENPQCGACLLTCADEVEKALDAHDAALWNEALEQAADEAYTHVGLGETREQVADAIRALKREKRGGE